jgi:peptidoglycan/xylan/chitin deacetylase (PgdA/CDA1 family)
MKEYVDLFLREMGTSKIPELVQQLANAALEAPAPDEDEADSDPVYGSLSGAVEIALTFDDGPKASTTPQILDELKKRDIRATFFVLGKMADRAAGKELVRRMLAEGHTVGNHSWNHPNFRKISKSKVRKEVERTQKLLESLGVTSRYIRAPYGATNKEVRALLHEMDMDLIGWNVDPEDWKHRSIEWVSRALQGVDRREDSNIVMHDIHASTAKHLPTFLDELEERYADRDLTFVNEF